ncbi:MAG: hypothetical protein AAGF97_01745 [Planctomycetota bacterium]
MEHRIFAIGVVCVLMGLQMRTVESFVLTPKASQFIEHNMRSSGLKPHAANYNYESILQSAGPVPKKTITPPRWLGWALISIGAVLTLHGISLRQTG